ncbi:uncharacterized protein LOC121385775 isoform X2 [Gigantopelta aegis]|nr:uncharacterized protein LOC121385775 isoform X2 [Gigantopelta aegis]
MLWLAVFLLFVRTSVSADWDPMVMNRNSTDKSNMQAPLSAPKPNFKDKVHTSTFDIKGKVKDGLSAKEVFANRQTQSQFEFQDIEEVVLTSTFDFKGKEKNGLGTKEVFPMTQMQNKVLDAILIVINQVYGNWGAWGAKTYGSCSTSCGSGERKYTRQRVCNNPKPSGNGTDCVGESVQIGDITCEIQPCPVDGQWGAWGDREYGPCSVTCGEGTRQYRETRCCCNPSPEFGGKPCPGVRERVGPILGCNVDSCSVDGAWTAWSQAYVGPCSVYCDGGAQQVMLVRSCDNPPPQNGGQNCSGPHTLWKEVLGCNPQCCDTSLVNEKVYVSNCSDVIEHNITTSGVFTIQPRDSGLALHAYCDIEDNKTAWLVIQRKSNGSTNFNKTWYEYRDGFGEIDSDYWLGNNDIHRITKQGQYELQIDLETNTAEKKHVMYDTFYVHSKYTYFTLNVIGFHGDIKDLLSPSDGKLFRTFDKMKIDNFCDEPEVGAFWLSSCFSLNLSKGNKTTWPPWCNGTCYITSSVMKIRPKLT